MVRPTLNTSKLHSSKSVAHPSRRDWLKWTVAASAPLAYSLSSAQAPLKHNPFTLGVASGSPNHHSVVLWTRLMPDVNSGQSYLANADVTVHWEVADDEHFKVNRRSGQVVALATLAHSVHLELEGLQSDRWYFYRFQLGDAQSTVGRTRTLPHPEAMVQKLRVAYASCQRWEHGYFSAYDHMAQENLDMVLFLGDYIYEYAAAANPVRIPAGGWVTSLSDYRNRYALHKSEKSLQAMHAQCPWLVTWDDHEVSNDYAGLVRGFSGNITLDFEAQRAQAYQAFYEHMPLRASTLTRSLEGLARGAEMRIYGQVAYGKLANIYLLDDRQYRDRQVCNKGLNFGSGWVDPEQCEAWLNPNRTLLGAQQEQWLNQSFGAARNDQRVWNVVAQQTLFGRRDYKLGAGLSLWNDGWDGYSAARQRMTQSMQNNALKNPVLIGGDVHENWVGHVMADAYKDDSAKIGVEFCGAGITARSAGNSKLAARLAENPHFIFADSERKGYGVVEFTAKQIQTELRVVDDVRLPQTKVETLAKFAVEAGVPQVQRVS
jgi:alkaline phosphatase D